MKTLVIVESPTKAKTIAKFLGKDYTVLSSFGHVRDLPKSKIGVDVDHNFEATYVIPPQAKQKVLDLKKAAKGCDDVILATDEDREGEAIAWHLADVLKLDTKTAKRIVFHEITKSAIEGAIEHPRTLDINLVDAQQSRRILDRLVGYELSPFLWSKVRRGLSAGRVQSVAMRLIVERERERRAFNVEEFWTVDAQFEKDATVFPAKLIQIGEDKIEKMSLTTGDQAKKLVDDLEGADAKVTNIEKKQVSKVCPKPYTTSSLQIDANNKLGFSAKQTMALAQKLYETGRITYMRTDSLNLAEKFLIETQAFITKQYGATYATGAKTYHTTKKGAQEAHEAIRPTEVTTLPADLKGTLEPREWRIYDLIWRRTVASQLPPAKLDRTSVDVLAKQYLFRANGSTVAFDGFMKVYQASQEKLLPELNVGDRVKTDEMTPNQHFTEPPARYSDATLVKVLEEHGIGRPSTYAPTISTIIDRGYVDRDDGKKLFPTDIAFIVNDLLVEHFKNIVDYAFTAQLEKTLDEIAEGTVEWVPFLEAFYKPFHQNLETKSKELDRADIMPDRELGKDPETGLGIFLRNGRFGSFVQVGEYTKEDKESGKPKPKSASLLKGMYAESATLEDALNCLQFPKTLGVGDDGVPITVDIGRFGPYLRWGETSASLGVDLNPVSIDLQTAKEVLKQAAERKRRMATPIAELGEDPVSKAPITIREGRYGVYVTDGTTNMSIKKSIDPLMVTTEMAIELLANKRAAGPSKRRFAEKKKRA